MTWGLYTPEDDSNQSDNSIYEYIDKDELEEYTLTILLWLIFDGMMNGLLSIFWCEPIHDTSLLLNHYSKILIDPTN